MKTGIAIIGIGRIGKIHALNLMNNCKVDIKYFVDIDVPQITQFKQQIGSEDIKCISLDNLDLIYNDDMVKGVVVCTPTHTHENIVLGLLNAGKSVMCEKPLSKSIKGTEECYRKADENNVRLLCAFNRRFDPQLVKVVDQLNDVGKIHSIKTCARDNPRPTIEYLKISGGMFHDCAVHDIDIVRWVLHENPTTVYATAHCNDPEIAKLDDVDTVFVVMKFPCGAIAHIDLARVCNYGYHQTVEIFGENGSLISDNVARSCARFAGRNGINHDVIQHNFKQRYAEAYKEEVEHFVDIINDSSKECKISVEDTVMATLIADACDESYRSGKVIDMKERYMSMNMNC